MYTVVAGYLKYKEHRIWEKIGSRDDEEELKNMLVLAPDYDTELLNLTFFGSEGHTAILVCDYFEDIYGWCKALGPNLLRPSSDDDIREYPKQSNKNFSKE